MSLAATSWAWQVDGLAPGPKLVLLAIADHHNESTGLCCPSMATLALRAGVSRRSARRHVELLRERGLVSTTDRTRANGSFTTHEYHLMGDGAPGANLAPGQGPPVAPGDAPADLRVVRAETPQGAGDTEATDQGPPLTPPEPTSSICLQGRDDQGRKPRHVCRGQLAGSPAWNLSHELASLVAARDPRAKVAPASDRWLTAMRLLLVDREQDVAEVTTVMRWCQANPFWQAVILSPTNLRAKFEQLRAQSLRAPQAAPVSARDQRTAQRMAAAHPALAEAPR